MTVKDTTYPLLVVEDNDEDFEMLRWALKKLSITIPVYRCVDGDDALDFLYHKGPYTNITQSPRPAIILLDLQLTATDGQEVLEQVKSDPDLHMIPVVVWTSSSDPTDIEVCFRQGANSYILKPMTIDRLLEAIELLNRYWFGMVVLPSSAEESL